MPIKKVVWICSICGTEHPTEKDAQACEDLGIPTPELFAGQLFRHTEFSWRLYKILDSKIRYYRNAKKRKHIIMHRVQRGLFLQHMGDAAIARDIERGVYKLI